MFKFGRGKAGLTSGDRRKRRVGKRVEDGRHTEIHPEWLGSRAVG